MKNQQVHVDVSLMITTALVYLGLAVSGWILFRLVQACFWLPSYLTKQREEEAEEEKAVMIKRRIEEDIKEEDELEEDAEEEEEVHAETVDSAEPEDKKNI